AKEARGQKPEASKETHSIGSHLRMVTAGTAEQVGCRLSEVGYLRNPTKHHCPMARLPDPWLSISVFCPLASGFWHLWRRSAAS
ncbi:MAG: hypothetical protein WC378_14260, partial [Opitutaceae bacterium]